MRSRYTQELIFHFPNIMVSVLHITLTYILLCLFFFNLTSSSSFDFSWLNNFKKCTKTWVIFVNLIIFNAWACREGTGQQSRRTQEHYKGEPTMGPQTCLRTKNLNKCSIAKLSQMTAPSVGLQRANRNRIKLYAYVKHSMLTFTRKSVNKKKFPLQF